MKEKFTGKYLWIFITGVLLIAVYKTFDNIEILFGWFLYLLGILAPVGAAFGIAFLLYPLAVHAERLLSKCKPALIKKNARPIGVIAVYAVIIAFLITVPSLIIPYIAKSVNELVVQFPGIFDKIMQFLSENNISSEIFTNHISVKKLISGISFESISKYISRIAGAGSAVFDIFVSVILSLYILIDRKSFKSGTMRIVRLYVKPEIRKTAGRYLRLTVDFIYKYICCQVIDGAVVMVLSSVMLAVMKVKYPLALGIFMGFMNLIPYFGAITACVVITVITMCFAGFMKGVWVLVALIVLQQIDANLIQPVIVKENLSVKPFWVLVGILVGGALFGIIGILLAVPFAAIAQIIIDDVLTNRENKIAKN